MGKIKTCVACGNRDGSISYYRVPREEKKRKEWLESSGADFSISISDDARICALHFAESAFTKSGDAVVCTRRLKKSAVPSIIIHDSGFNRQRSKRCHTCCFICGSWRNTENISFFRFPRDINQQNEWLKILGIENVSSSVINTKRLCSIHFNKVDIINNPKFVKPSLRKGCVPINHRNCHRLKTATAVTSEEIVHEMDTNEISSDPVVQMESDKNDMINEAIKNESGPVFASGKNDQSDEVFILQADKSISNSLNLVVTPTTRSIGKNQKSRLQEPYNISGFSTPHLKTSRRAKRVVDKAKVVIKSQRKVIHSLRRKLRTALAKVKTMGDSIQYLKSQLHISEDTMLCLKSVTDIPT